MKAAFKLSRAILHLLRGYWIIKTQFTKINGKQRANHVQQWSAQVASQTKGRQPGRLEHSEALVIRAPLLEPA